MQHYVQEDAVLRDKSFFMKVSELSSVIKAGLDSDQLIARDSGQGSPCLDLAKLNDQVTITNNDDNITKTLRT